METAAIIGSIVGVYVLVLGCYVFTFTLWANLSTKFDALLRETEARLTATINSRNGKLDDIAKCVAKLEGRHELEDRDSDVRRL